MRASDSTPIRKDPDTPDRINNPIPKNPGKKEKLPDEPNFEPDPDEHLIKPEIQDPDKQSI